MDSGSNYFLLLKRVISKDLLKHLDGSNYTINGVNGASMAAVQFVSAVSICDATFNDFRIIVTDN
jgi:hypothetical protein